MPILLWVHMLFCPINLHFFLHSSPSHQITWISVTVALYFMPKQMMNHQTTWGSQQNNLSVVCNKLAVTVHNTPHCEPIHHTHKGLIWVLYPILPRKWPLFYPTTASPSLCAMIMMICLAWGWVSLDYGYQAALWVETLFRSPVLCMCNALTKTFAKVIRYGKGLPLSIWVLGFIQRDIWYCVELATVHQYEGGAQHRPVDGAIALLSMTKSLSILIHFDPSFPRN